MGSSLKDILMSAGLRLSAVIVGFMNMYRAMLQMRSWLLLRAAAVVGTVVTATAAVTATVAPSPAAACMFRVALCIPRKIRPRPSTRRYNEVLRISVNVIQPNASPAAVPASPVVVVTAKVATAALAVPVVNVDKSLPTCSIQLPFHSRYFGPQIPPVLSNPIRNCKLPASSGRVGAWGVDCELQAYGCRASARGAFGSRIRGDKGLFVGKISLMLSLDLSSRQGTSSIYKLEFEVNSSKCMAPGTLGIGGTYLVACLLELLESADTARTWGSASAFEEMWSLGAPRVLCLVSSDWKGCPKP